MFEVCRVQVTPVSVMLDAVVRLPPPPTVVPITATIRSPFVGKEVIVTPSDGNPVTAPFAV